MSQNIEQEPGFVPEKPALLVLPRLIETIKQPVIESSMLNAGYTEEMADEVSSTRLGFGFNPQIQEYAPVTSDFLGADHIDMNLLGCELNEEKAFASSLFMYKGGKQYVRPEDERRLAGLNRTGPDNYYLVTAPELPPTLVLSAIAMLFNGKKYRFFTSLTMLDEVKERFGDDAAHELTEGECSEVLHAIEQAMPYVTEPPLAILGRL